MRLGQSVMVWVLSSTEVTPVYKVEAAVILHAHRR